MAGRSPHAPDDPVEETRQALSDARPTPAAFRNKLHLVTQNGQPYGSVRRCCEKCGIACGPFWHTPANEVPHDWTDDREKYEASARRCR